MNDPELVPFLKAMAEVDRAAMGFTQISTQSVVRIERHDMGGAYDVMLHIENGTSRTIAFRKVGDRYRWINEQEKHVGPGKFTMPDGVTQECLFVIHQTERLSGDAVGKTVISYFGDNEQLKRPDLTLEDVRGLIAKWDALKIRDR